MLLKGSDNWSVPGLRSIKNGQFFHPGAITPPKSRVEHSNL